MGVWEAVLEKTARPPEDNPPEAAASIELDSCYRISGFSLAAPDGTSGCFISRQTVSIIVV